MKHTKNLYIFSKIHTGASDDFEKVTNIAYAMVQMYGMNKEMGCLAWNPENMKQYAFKPFSENTAERIDFEVRKLVDEQYLRVKDLLQQYKERVYALSDRLFEKETLVFADLKEVLGPRPWPLKKEYAKFVDTEINVEPVTKEPEDLKEIPIPV